MKFDLRRAINIISDVVMNRPAPLREFDHIYMRVADIVIQADHVAHVKTAPDLRRDHSENPPLRIRVS